MNTTERDELRAQAKLEIFDKNPGWEARVHEIINALANDANHWQLDSHRRHQAYLRLYSERKRVV